MGEMARKKFRNEWKFVCAEDELKLLYERLGAILVIDEHAGENGKYLIRSLYFDDYEDRCMRDNEAGVGNRFKWRIRYYDGGPSKYIHLEWKQKRDGRTHKEMCALTERECMCLIRGEVESVMWGTKEKLLKRFCAEMMLKKYEPKVIIDYERVAFTEPVLNIRVTLDMNISAGYDFEKFLIGGYQCFPLQEKKRHVLEVKFDEVLPGYVRNIVTASRLTQTSFSKYGLGRKKLEEVLR